MRSLSENELENYKNWFKDRILGAQLQDVRGDQTRIVFELYRFQLYWLLFDFHRIYPQVIFCENEPPISKRMTPLALFLASHAEGLHLRSLDLRPGYGRVMDLMFEKGPERQVHFQALLIPHAVNAIATADKKKVSLYRPTELKERPVDFTFSATNERSDFTQIGEEYFRKRAAPEPAGQSASASVVDKIKKKETALKKLNELHFDDDIRQLFSAGEKLKNREELADEEKKWINDKLNRSGNIKIVFEKGKKLRDKREGHLSRIQILQEEIRILRDRLIRDEDAPSEMSPIFKRSRGSVSSTGTKMRTLSLKDGRTARIGKTSTDNLQLLRDARAWDYWIHLRDEPSAHAILFRNKNQSVPDEEIREVGRWIFREKKKKKILMPGLRVTLIVCECRHVRPLKGDKHGRVTYSEGRTIDFPL